MATRARRTAHTAPPVLGGAPTQPATRPLSNKRVQWGTMSHPVSKITISLGPKFGDIKRDMLMGNKNVVCQTRAENKANKQNRSEQLKLQSYENRLLKEHNLNNRLFRQKEAAFRIRSANVLKARPTDINIRRLEKRAQSAANTNVRDKQEHGSTTTADDDVEAPAITADDNDPECAMCAQIQTLMRTYKEDGHPTPLPEDVQHGTDHSKCMFSDSEAKEFLHILESKYFREMSDLKANVTQTGLFTPALSRRGRTMHQISMEELEYRNTNKEISNKIKEFCIEMDRFNKEHDLVPESVKHEFESSRIANAIVKTERPRIRTPSRQQILRRKVEHILKL